MQAVAAVVVTAVHPVREVPTCNACYVVTCAVLLESLAGCHQEGPAEKAGKSINNAGQRGQDTLDPPKGVAQSAGRSVDRALGIDTTPYSAAAGSGDPGPVPGSGTRSNAM